MKHNRSWLGRTSIACLMLLVFVLGACSPSKSTLATQTASAQTSGTSTAAALIPTATATPKPIVLEGAKTTASGLQYLEETPGTGNSPQDGDVVLMNYIASLPDGTELYNTYTQNRAATAILGRDQLLPGWEEGLRLMKVGGKSKLVLPPELAFGEQGSGMIPANSQVVIELELISSNPAPAPTVVAADKLQKTDSGLQYYDIKVGTGTEAISNTTVSTHYTLWVKGDTENLYIVSSEGSKPVSFVLGRGDTVFPGWEEGVKGMKVGGKRQLIVPPDLALGEQGSGEIPANATLILEIELADVREPAKITKVDEKDYTTTASGLKFYDIVKGTGSTPKSGDKVVVQYTGWLQDGTQFDSSYDRNEPFTFTLGAGDVIPGWDEGVSTMTVGSKRQLVIPPDLGYGETGAGSVIPPNATLVFEVELVEIQQP